MSDDDAEPGGGRPGGGSTRDSLFRSVFGNPVHAASELRSVLPDRLLDRLDLSRLELMPDTYVDADLRQRHVDALFSTRWAGRDALLYVLMEHQSTPDPLMAYRMLVYLVRIWEKYVRLNPKVRRLPVIVPVVIYQGQRRWNVSTEFADLLDLDPGLELSDLEDAVAEGIVPRFRYLLDDVSKVDVPALRARPLTEEARLALVLLGLPAGVEDLMGELGGWGDSFAVVQSRLGGRETVGRFAAYVWKISRVSRERMAEVMATMNPEVAETFMSTWDMAVAEGRTEGLTRGRAEGQAAGLTQGRAEGRDEGRAEGRTEVFAGLLALKFGDLDEDVLAAVRAASADQIAAWSARLIEGTLTLGDVTG